LQKVTLGVEWSNNRVHLCLFEPPVNWLTSFYSQVASQK